MYKIDQNINQNNAEIDQQIIDQYNLNYIQTQNNKTNIKNQNKIKNQLENHYENKYRKNKNNQLQYLQNQELINDITKMHLIPPKCPMTPQSFTDFFNDTSQLKKAAPYKLLYEQHPKDLKIHTKIEYNNFYSDWKKDAINYNDKKYTTQYLDYTNNSNNSNNNANNNMNVNTLYGSNIRNKEDKDNISENIKIYEETKNQKGFAVPMKSNGSNTVETLYDNCLNKRTFEYKRFGYNMLSPQEPNKVNHLVDNPLYNNYLSEETNSMYENYLNSRIKNASNIYDIIFEDMYYLGYSPNDDNDNKDNNDNNS